ncbi:MAG: cytochrome c oxidase accessory protein CcoG [Saprospirales bacterium]|nr:cytochrome c oxidase accessory protein CcoG [Saprospirales bacterium]
MNKDIEKVYQDTESFRDRLATVDKQGKRIWVYPKKPSGRFYKWRTIVSWVLLAALFTMPFIKVNGEQFLLLNVLEGKFVIFGMVFTPQDLHLFALAMMTLMIFIVLFTVVFGRIFCGWVCPQTIFMEMVFRKIEYLIEGDASQQRKLNAAPWTTEKVIKKVSKHAIFYGIAVVIANLFLSYIIGSDRVLEIISEPISEHFGGFIAMLIFAGLFYGVFAFMREQVCTTICPYGRMQSVLIVPETIVVIYDFVRGEPRGKLKKSKAKAKANPATDIAQTVAAGAASPEVATAEAPIKVQGDCIDCGLCVRVCPTGIDIRNGTQLECVNCTACIDACDSIMEKVGKPKGLIRYDSLIGVEKGVRKIFTWRVAAYSAVLVALLVLQAALLITRSDVELQVFRTPGQLYQKVDDTWLANLYNWEMVNKTSEDIPNVEFRVLNFEGARIRYIGDNHERGLAKNALSKGVMFIDLPIDKVGHRKTELVIGVYANGKLIDKTTTNFLGPIK